VVGEKILAISTHLAVPSSQSPIVGDSPTKIGAQSPNGRDLPVRSPAGVSLFSVK